MLRARLRDLVNACKDVILMAREDHIDFIDDSDDNDSYGATDDMVVQNNSVESEYRPVAAIKRPWPLSWIPPKHLRHPDWEYEN